MTNEPIVPSVLNVQSVGIDVSNDLKMLQRKSIAQCLYDQSNSTNKESSEKTEEEKNNEEKNS